ncbi:MAG: ankyrin repeat domain-containing protein [Kofleriaceae bacterium]
MSVNEEEAKAFLLLVGNGKLDEVKQRLKEVPELVNAVGPHPFWGGRPQPLHVAIETKQRDMFEELLDAGADIDGDNAAYAGWSPLMVAIAEEDRKKFARALLQEGAHVGLPEALLMGDDKRVAKLLKKHGRKLLAESVPSDGSWLALARTPTAIDRLIALGVSTTARDRWGASPMEALSRTGNRALVHHLVARGIPADPVVYARLGETQKLKAMRDVAKRDEVFIAAVEFGHKGLVEWLLANGANVNARQIDRSHGTGLHGAAWEGDLEMVELLLAHGADPNLLDEEHHGTPLQFAEVSRKITNNPACDAVIERLRGVTTHSVSNDD